jgi:hypothetical protein
MCYTPPEYPYHVPATLHPIGPALAIQCPPVRASQPGNHVRQHQNPTRTGKAARRPRPPAPEPHPYGQGSRETTSVTAGTAPYGQGSRETTSVTARTAPNRLPCPSPPNRLPCPYQTITGTRPYQRTAHIFLHVPVKQLPGSPHAFNTVSQPSPLAQPRHLR